MGETHSWICIFARSRFSIRGVSVIGFSFSVFCAQTRAVLCSNRVQNVAGPRAPRGVRRANLVMVKTLCFFIGGGLNEKAVAC